MNLKEYLNQACILEYAVYEKTERIKNTKNCLFNLEENVSKKKENLKQKQSDITNAVNKTIKALESEKKYKQSIKKESFISNCSEPLVFFGCIAAIILLYHILLRVAVPFLYSSLLSMEIVENQIIILFGATLITNVLPSFIIASCLAYYKNYNIKWSYIISHFILQVYAFNITCIHLSNLDKMGTIIFVAAAILLLIDGIICTVICLDWSKSEHSRFVDAKQNSQERIKNLAALLLKEKKRLEDISNEITQFDKKSLNEIENVKKKINTLKNELAVANHKLTEHYNKNVIHPKYRTWLAVATIYEYLDTGICNNLTGPNGAYKFYEEDLRAQKIAGSVNELRIKAESACYMQTTLKREIDKINSRLIDD